jgi:hypothetical protein
MQTLIRTLALSLAVLALGACKQDSAAPAAEAPAAAAVALPVPALNDDMAWRDYLRATVKQHMQGIRRSPFMYYLSPISSAESAEVWEDQYQRQFDNVASNISRGVLPGNMLAFGSPEYERIATLAVDAFASVSPNSMKDVRVLFIGRTEDKDRVAEAVAPSGAEFVFHAVD